MVEPDMDDVPPLVGAAVLTPPVPPAPTVIV
jgi:hypothetical protein